MQTTMQNGIRCETVKHTTVSEFWPSYRGRIAVYEGGTRLYSLLSEIQRRSRGDALRDAQVMAHDLRVQNFLKGD